MSVCVKSDPANVAQLVEQLIRNEQVGGSSPPIGSMSKRRFRSRERRFCVWEALRLATIEVEVPEGVPEGTTTSSLSVNKLTV